MTLHRMRQIVYDAAFYICRATGHRLPQSWCAEKHAA